MLRNIKRRVKSFGGDGNRRPGDVSPTDTFERPLTPEALADVKPGATTKKKKKTARAEDLMSKIPHLSNFDKCIETSDAITASSSAQQTESIFTDRKDPSTGLPDCSLLVSPEGDLLLVPTGENPELMFLTPKKKTRSSTLGSETCDDEELSTPKSSFSELMLNGKDDYESSIFIGDDLHGEKTLNRFSAKGWSVPATSWALEQTNHSCSSLARFCEQVILANKERAARATIACDNFKNDDARKSSSKSVDQWEIIDPRATDFEQTNARVGPFNAETSTVRVAVAAVENYYRTVAEKETKRFRVASLQRRSVLPAMHEASDLFGERVIRRQKALQEATRRARIMEDRLTRCKKLSEKRWQAVYKAEEKVTKKVGDLLSTRSRERQKVRLKQLQQDQTAATDLAPANKMSEDVWNLVSSVADSMDNGSYEPMCLPGSDAASFISDEASTTSSVNVEKDNEPMLPMANREEIEQDLGLPELRKAAMQADEDIQDAADALLNILSTIDTTRRSARLAAETSLVSAGNAQAACLRSMVQLEREALEERLRDLKETEDALDSIDVRMDLDMYIDLDKQERGGSSHLGEDDDGGIASALATLSSHVDKTFGDDNSSHRTRSSGTMGDDSEKDNDGMSPVDINDAIAKLFADNPSLKNDADPSSDAVQKTRALFDKNAEFLCLAAYGNSSSARTRRSSLCYSLNSQRGPNARIATQIQFDAVSKIFAAVLSGCNEEEDGNAKLCMLMMLAQTFYIDEADAEGGSSSIDESLGPSPSRQARKRRIYVKSKLINHPVWSKDEFWDVALSQQISESLAHSGVMANFTRIKQPVETEYTQHRRTHWHDLSHTERIEAASQVHAVVFAQLGALAHSMIELGCGLERSCAFVRRMAIRNQLPSSQKTMLLKHLMDRDDVGRRETKIIPNLDTKQESLTQE